MKKALIYLIVLFLGGFVFFSLPVFGGETFCFPGVKDNGPGTVGCFYSEGSHYGVDQNNQLVKISGE